MENNVLKIFIYDSNGQKINEKDYDLIEETINEINEHNSNDIENIYNLYIGNNFPPENYQWNNSLKNWENNEGNSLKVFVYNNNGEKIQEKEYTFFLDVYQEIIKKNESDFFSNYQIYSGSEYPPKDHFWDPQKENWVKNQQNNTLESNILDENFNIEDEEILLEEVFDDQNSNILKIYIKCYNILLERYSINNSRIE